MSGDRGPSPEDLAEDEALRRALGKAIGIRRLELGLKRNDLRDRSKLSYPYIAELENGTKRGSTRSLYALASALELSVSELMERAEVLRDQEADAIPMGPAPAVRSGSWFAGSIDHVELLESSSTVPLMSERPQPPRGRQSYTGRSRSSRVEVDVDDLRHLVRQIVREEVRDAVREALQEFLPPKRAGEPKEPPTTSRRRTPT